MKAGSSASGCGSMECPYCHVPLIRIQSKKKATFGQWFVKCPYNIYGDPTTCPYIRPEVPDVKLEAQEHLKAKKLASCEYCSELKAEVLELKQTLDSVVVDLWKLKVKPAEPIPEEIIPEPSHEPKLGPKQIVIDYSVFMCFVGVLIGVVIACMWK